MEPANVALAPARRVTYQRAVNGDLVGLQVAQHLFIRGLAAVLLAVADYVDDAAAALGTCRKLLGGSQDSIVEGVDLLGDGHESSAASRVSGGQIGIDAVAILANVATGHRPIVDGHQHLLAGSLGHGEHEWNPGTLRAGKAPGTILRAVVIGKNREFVVWRERALNSAQGVVHLGHHVGGQALINDESDRQRERIRGEKGNGLARFVLEYLEVAVGEAGYKLSLRVFYSDRNFDKINTNYKFRDRLHALTGGGHLGRRGLHLVLALAAGSLAGGRGLLNRRI